MRLVAALFATVTVVMPSAGLAQHGSCAGQESRDIKALSAEEVKQYLAGAGMGLARVAELNRYPGPMYVLELVDALQLSPERRTATRELMDSHKAQARDIGAKLIDAEHALDRLFTEIKTWIEPFPCNYYREPFYDLQP